ncbi:MAG: hypothetical protein KGL12_16170 [Rhodospirillales bacterium]|nr:hypothetical protein [Rhodospirillales bacterium]
MNRRQPHHSEDGQDEVSWFTLIAFMAASVLTICASVFFVLSTVDFAPDVGDIVRFRPGQSMADFTRFAVPAHFASRDPMAPTEAATEGGCLLRPDVMTERGGSLVIEARGLTGSHDVRVHWQGGPTARGAENCGGSATLILSQNDLRALANVAGGFGASGPRNVF